MNKTFSMFFFLRRKAKDSNGISPIYLRITLDGCPSEISTKRNIQNSRWDVKGQRDKGYSDEAKNLNFYLNTFKEQIYKTYQKLLMNDKDVNIRILKEALVGKKDERTIVPIFKDHNERVKVFKCIS